MVQGVSCWSRRSSTLSAQLVRACPIAIGTSRLLQARARRRAARRGQLPHVLPQDHGSRTRLLAEALVSEVRVLRHDRCTPTPPPGGLQGAR